MFLKPSCFLFTIIFISLCQSQSASKLPSLPKRRSNTVILPVAIRSSTTTPKPQSFRIISKSCPESSFVYAMSLQFKTSNSPLLQLRTGDLIGINLACDSQPNMTEISVQTETQTESSSRKQWKVCNGDGLVVGYHYRKDSVRNGSKNKVSNIIFYCKEIGDDAIPLIGNGVGTGAWNTPEFCQWGQFVCGIHVRHELDDNTISNVETECCQHPEMSNSGKRQGWLNYGEVNGKIIKSHPYPIFNNLVYDHYFKDGLDHPYYFDWTFCPITTYVTGLQLKNGARDFRFACSDPRKTATNPRNYEWISSSEWDELDEENFSSKVKCHGVAIGIQVQFHTEHGIQAVRLFCSYSEIENQLSYIEGLFKPFENAKEKDGSWQETQLCGKNQAICGFKNKRSGKPKKFLDHFKVKCCDVPAIEEICFPGDTEELIVECDGTNAIADTICVYSQTEGISISNTINEGDRRNIDFHQSLSNDWAITEGKNEQKTKSESDGEVIGNSQGTSETNSTNLSINLSKTHLQINSSAISTGSTSGNSSGSGQTSGSASTSGGSSDKTQSNSETGIKTNSQGGSDSSSSCNSFGSTQSIGSGSVRSNSYGDSQSSTKGVSKGHVSANSRGSSTSDTSSKTRGSHDSNTDGNSNTKSRGNSNSHSVNVGISATAEAGFNIGIAKASVAVTMSAGYSHGWGSGEENSQTHHSSRSTSSSNQNSVTFGSGRSTQQSNQATKDESNSNSQSNSNDHTSSDTSNMDSVTNNQRGQTIGKGNNFQATKTDQEGNSMQTSDGKSTTNSTSNTSSTNVESALLNNNQISQDKSQTSHKSVGQNQGSSFTKTEHIESSIHRNKNRSNDRSRGLNFSKSQSKNLQSGNSFTTGYDWSHSSNHVWNVEKSHTITMNVPPGIKTRLYQTVGYCGFYRVRTSVYTRKDNGSVNTFGCNAA